MINLGVIGTNWITRVFVDAALATGQYQLSVVYSRKLATAQKFAEDFSDVEFATDLATFVNIAHLNTIYIASPNSLHFEQAKAAILAGKNVIVEKPAFSTPDEMNEIIHLANEQRVFFFEAARNIHETGFKKISDFLCDKQVIGANFTFLKYSSRYDAVLNGEEPNILSPHFSGGALMDLGVYLVYAALGWFGLPRSQYYFAQKIVTGVDGLGLGVLRYEDFDVALQTGKIGDSFLPSEIYLAEGTIILSGVSILEKAEYYDRITKKTIVLFDQGEKLPMFDQATDFAAVIQHPKDAELGEQYQEWVELSRNVNEVIYALRQQAKITFDADK